jgi:proline iminopeptidase
MVVLCFAYSFAVLFITKDMRPVKCHLLLIFVLSVQFAFTQTIYSKTYGKTTDPAILYVHGGPRGNATLFEGTAAQELAAKGFYVIVYDRRGEGRSIDTTATFTFREAIKDVNVLLQQYQLKKVTIIGHSFGGIVATLYTAQNPEKVERLILLGALFSQQETYDHILGTVYKKAIVKQDTATLHKIALIKTLNKNGADYRKKCYEVAGEYAYFRMPNPTEESKKVNLQYEQGEFSKQNIRNDLAPIRFYQNEKLVNIDTKQILRKIKNKHVGLFAVYGKQDGVFSGKQLTDMKTLVGEKRFYGIDNCSHYPFVDQRTIFLQTIEQIMSTKP